MYEGSLESKSSCEKACYTSSPRVLPETHLLIIWEKGRYAQHKVLGDLSRHSRINAVFEISWEHTQFSSNLSRFYGEKLPDGSYKEKHCGKGPFLLAIFQDANPNYQRRRTSKGEELVNANSFDSKTKYRSWTGGGHRVHATNNPSEVRHDLALLLGQESAKYLSETTDNWDGNIVHLDQNLAGAKSWKNMEELFFVLNNTVDYVVLRNFEAMPKHYYLDTHGDIDLLTNDLKNMTRISNASPVFKANYRVHYYVVIGGQKVPFDFRYVGDGYYDKRWETNILENKQSHRGFFVPGEQDHFFSLLYHVLVHKNSISCDYRSRLYGLAQHLGISDWAVGREQAILEAFLKRQGFHYEDPYDLSVYFNPCVVGTANISLRRRLFNFLCWPKRRLRRVGKKILLEFSQK